MIYTFDIAEDNSVKIYENNAICFDQPVSPITGVVFASVDEATEWAESVIAERQSWYE
jgi:hypothetical protein